MLLIYFLIPCEGLIIFYLFLLTSLFLTRFLRMDWSFDGYSIFLVLNRFCCTVSVYILNNSCDFLVEHLTSILGVCLRSELICFEKLWLESSCLEVDCGNLEVEPLFLLWLSISWSIFELLLLIMPCSDGFLSRYNFYLRVTNPILSYGSNYNISARMVLSGNDCVVLDSRCMRD